MKQFLSLSPLLAVGLLAAGCGGSPAPVNPDLAVVSRDMAPGRDMTTGVDMAPGRDMTTGVDMAPGGDMAPPVAKTFTVTLTKAAETPVCVSAGASATGSAKITIDAGNTMIAVSNFTYSGLSGAATMAHIHSGAAGASGGAIFTFTNLTSPISQTFTAANYPASPPTGAPANFAAFVAAMKAGQGQAYLNVHTAACGPGEIRAQIM